MCGSIIVLRRAFNTHFTMIACNSQALPQPLLKGCVCICVSPLYHSVHKIHRVLANTHTHQHTPTHTHTHKHTHTHTYRHTHTGILTLEKLTYYGSGSTHFIAFSKIKMCKT